MGFGARMSQAGYFSEFVKGTGMAELAFRSWEGRNANVLNCPLIQIGCFLFNILTIESPRAFLSQRYGFESIDFIFS